MKRSLFNLAIKGYIFGTLGYYAQKGAGGGFWEITLVIILMIILYAVDADKEFRENA